MVRGLEIGDWGLGKVFFFLRLIVENGFVWEIVFGLVAEGFEALESR